MSNWVVLELGPKAEGEDPDIVVRSIRGTLRADVEVFIPAAVTTVGEDKVIRYLVEGYGFVRYILPDNHYLRLENTKYVNAVLRTVRGATKALAHVDEREIDRLRLQVRAEAEQGIGVGDTVMVTSGPYRHITAVVYEDIHELDTVQVFIKLRSKEALVSLPRNFLKLVQKAERPASHAQVEEILTWFRHAKPILTWTNGGLSNLVAHHQTLARLSNWFATQQTLVGYLRAFDASPVDGGVLRQRGQDLLRLTEWLGRTSGLSHAVQWLQHPLQVDVPRLQSRLKDLAKVKQLDDRLQQTLPYVKAAMTTFSPEKLKAKLKALAWLTQTMNRLRTLGDDVNALELELDSTAADVSFEDAPPKRAIYVGPDVQNIIIDGLNLAIRCMMAPGLGELRDTKGRPSGVYIGFLRSLGSLLKRWPTAQIHVCWDGSSKRRKAVFPEYKADRPSLPLQVEEIEWLRQTLPSFGVSQTWNRDEEADDTIATMVRTQLAGQQNIFMSTDKDLFQLVTETDLFLYPAVGKAKETLYNPAAVTERWGVPPERIVTLRAMLGDASDRIPGVGSVPQKVLVNLVRGYGTVDKIFSSNLAGLTKLQYEKLTGAESLVRRNIDLMTLRQDLQTETVTPRSDRAAAAQRLLDVDAKPEPILAAFFERSAGLTSGD